jgi:formylglycine-generating enzyme required for sulfatase activity
MSEFDSRFQDARRKQQKIYLFAFVAIVVAIVIVSGALLAGRGTIIEIQPDDANLTGALSIKKGSAFTLGTTIYSLTGGVSVDVSANGFETQRRWISPEMHGQKVTVTLSELPARLIVTAVPASSKTRWKLNSRLLGSRSSVDLTLKPGSYVVEANNPYFQHEDLQIELARAETREVSLNLKPIEGLAEVATFPTNAVVSLNGSVIGRAPIVLTTAGGSHRVGIEMENFVPITDTIEITRDKLKIERTYKLKPVSASIVADVTPPNGELLLDGKSVEPSLTHQVDSLRQHRLIYTKPGYLTKSEVFELSPGEERTFTMRLDLEKGDVEILSMPVAEIVLNGKKVGTTPMILSLTAQPQMVEIKKKGYRTIRRKITPSSRQRVLIDEQLVLELAARLDEAPKAYRTVSGISLKFFKPNGFTMGAPRYQRGQRANELLRFVNMKRPFYAGAHEITNQQYREFRKGHEGLSDEPVTNVTWINAAIFCNWLSEVEGLSVFYRIDRDRLIGINVSAEGYRLLTEAEWEWLARKAGRTTQTVFPWGDSDKVPRQAGNIADELANGITRHYVAQYTDGFARVAPVGTFPAEASGLFDLTGNVSEWVHDYYSLSPVQRGSVESDPIGPTFGETHVIKGASWRSGTRTTLRAPYREGLANKREDVGFRIGRYLYGGDNANAR